MALNQIDFNITKVKVNAPTRKLGATYTWRVNPDLVNWARMAQGNKETLNNFPRVYNRKKIHSIDDFTKAGYPYVILSDEKMDDYHSIKAWCVEQFGRYKFVPFGYHCTFVFEINNDKTMFMLRWL